MKTKNCLVQLTYVPEPIYWTTDGSIDKGKFLTHDAIDCLLKGEMFSSLDCMWHYAALCSDEEARQAIRQLTEFGLVGEIVNIL